MAEGFACVEGHRQIFRFFLFYDANQFPGKTIDPGSRFAFGCLPALVAAASGQRKIHSVG